MDKLSNIRVVVRKGHTTSSLQQSPLELTIKIIVLCQEQSDSKGNFIDLLPIVSSKRRFDEGVVILEEGVFLCCLEQLVQYFVIDKSIKAHG